jgi:putative ABC transport system permease protein
MGRVVRAGVGRRRVQTVVMSLTTLISVAASVLAVGLLVASDAPFDHAFASQHGAHLTAQFNGVTAKQLVASTHATGVTAAAGPFQTVSGSPTTDAGPVAGAQLGNLTLAGRANAEGAVDHITIVDGHWVTGPGQIVLSTQGIGVSIGSTLTFPDLPGHPRLTVVGSAQSVTDTADAWVTPGEAATLNPSGAAATYEMLYRFAHADTAAQISTDRAAIAATLPHGALTGTQSYLVAKQHSDENAKAFVPFVAAFGVLGLALSVLIIVIIVSGAVSAGTRRIGILKSLGFTPAQVGRAYLAQALIPAVLGAAIGVLVGNLLAIPALHDVEVGYGSASASVPSWVDITVPAIALALVAGAALVPALRAGRLRTAEAIAVGRTPGVGRGRLVRRLTGRLPLSRPVSLGLANPFARPARSATTTAAVALAAVAVTLGVGLAMSLNAVEKGRDLDSAGGVAVHTGGGTKPAPPVGQQPGGPQSSAPADPAKVAAAIKAQPGTKAFYGTSQLQLGVSGIAGHSPVIAYNGDSSWATPQMITGHWLTGPGQAVVTSRFLEAASVHVGDSVTLTSHGRHTAVRVVGEAFFLNDEAMDLLTESSSLAGLGPQPKPSQFNIELKSGTSVSSYTKSLNSVLRPIGADAESNTANSSDVIATMDALIGILTLMLVTAAALGVLNTVVLDTRERVHDLGVFKALGMSPRQTVTMVITSVATIGLIAGAVGVPIGVLVHDSVIHLMGDAIDVRLAPAEIGVYAIPVLIGLAITGLVVAVAGALLPAGWAARTRTANALRTE